MIHQNHPTDDTVVDVLNAKASSPIVLVCEHASAFIPEVFEGLGVTGEALTSHVAWDPGALALANRMAEHLDAVLVAAKTSRLVYDCNRPPDAPDAMPARSEIVDVPGNANLSAAQKADRVANYYAPFRAAVSDILGARRDPVLITVHSFTRVYHGQPREVEIGVLHDADARLADALLSNDGMANQNVQRNEPYGPDDGVTHTLQEHALPGGLLNVMLEVRNDLIADTASQTVMADRLSTWIEQALAKTEAAAC